MKKLIKLFTSAALGFFAVTAHADTNITENLTLTADLDLRGQGTVTIDEGVTVWLNGHTLSVSGLAGDGAICAGYVPLEYVESTGWQYINSGVIANTDSKWGAATFTIDADLAFTGVSSAWAPIASSSYPSGQHNCGLWAISQKWSYWYDSALVYGNTLSIGARYRVAFTCAKGAQSLSVNETTECSGRLNAGVGNTSIPLYVFARNNGNEAVDSFGCFKLYALKLSRGSACERDYVPMKRLEDKVAGLYDKVTGTFFPSETDTPLVAGPELDAIENSGGELLIDVPSDTTVNSSVTLWGSLKVVKEGTGTFVTSKAQTYDGGTVINAGIVRSTVVNGFGRTGSTVKVASGGQVRYEASGSSVTLRGYVVDIAGTGPDGTGAICSTMKAGAYNDDYLEGLSLSSDATIAVGVMDSFNLFSASANRLPLALNGHALALVLSGRCIVNNVDVTDGGDIVVTGGPFYAYGVGADAAGIFATNTTFTVAEGSKFDGSAQMTVSNFVFNGIWDQTDGVRVSVLDRYTPGASASGQPQVIFGDASHLEPVLDLSGLTAPCNGDRFGFIDNSTVTVDVGTRSVAVGDRLVSWNDPPTEGLGVNFALTGEELDPEALEIALVPRRDGLYVQSTARPTFAKIDLSGDTPTWTFFMKDGSPYPGEWTEGVTSDIQVRFSSYAEYVAIKAQGVSPDSFLMTGFDVPEGTETMDMSSETGLIFADNMVFDVKGNTLKLPYSLVCGSKPFTVTSSVAGGELVLDVPETGSSIGISSVSLEGQLRLRKTGAGKLFSWKAQTYSGGTIVEEGTALPPNPLNKNDITYCWNNFKAFGTGEIVVNAGATFDLRAEYAYCNKIVLAGGTLWQSGPYAMTSTVMAGSGIGRLTADSTLLLGDSLVYGDIGEGQTTDLGGHTLTVDGQKGTLYMRTSVTNGTFDAVSTQFWLYPVVELTMTTTVAKISCALDLTAAGMSVKDYVARYPDLYNRGQKELKVFGTFQPNAVKDGVEYFYGCTMQDGSTLDLSGKTGPWNTTSASQNRNTVSFADGAMVTVDMHGRRLENGEWLMTWNQAPSNLDGLTFRLDDASVARGYRVSVYDGGLRVYHGLAIYVR